MQLAEQKSNIIELDRQKQAIWDNTLLLQTLNGMNIFVVILNKNREIVFVNDKLLKALNITYEEAIGTRPGELLKCRYAHVSKQGCGYAKECSLCAAKNLVVEAIHTDHSTEGAVSIVSAIGGLEITSSFEEKVTVLEVNQQKYYMVAFVDKSLEVEKYNMERIFYHDILNTATSLYHAIELMKLDHEKYKEDEEIHIIERVIKNIIDEIEYQRNITRAEQNELEVTYSQLDIVDLCNDIVKVFKKDNRFFQIPIRINASKKSVLAYSDRTLLRRIIINLIKNALEESGLNQEVVVTIKQHNEQLLISVHNNQAMPEDIKRNIFEKGHSRKGKGRGFGTYGSKLLLNRYLNGDLTFTSNQESGTTFTIIIQNEVI